MRRQLSACLCCCVAFFSQSHCGDALTVNSAAHPAASNAHDALPEKGSNKKRGGGVEERKRNAGVGLAVKRRRRAHHVSSGFRQQKRAQFIGVGLLSLLDKHRD